VAATAVAPLALGGLTGGASLGLAATKTGKSTTHTAGQACTKAGSTSKTKSGKTLTCEKAGKKLKWETAKKAKTKAGTKKK
jgi:hypothetical protein